MVRSLEAKRLEKKAAAAGIPSVGAIFVRLHVSSEVTFEIPDDPALIGVARRRIREAAKRAGRRVKTYSLAVDGRRRVWGSLAPLGAAPAGDGGTSVG